MVLSGAASSWHSLPTSLHLNKNSWIALENRSFSLWPKASDHEVATDVGWLLYSTRQQDEKRITLMLSFYFGEHIGAKW
jgi:hypothetical protein